MRKIIMNWSGGKDSTLVLDRLLKDPSDQVKGLLTTINAHYRRITMHGVRVALLEAQAQAIGLPLYTVSLSESVSMDDYSQRMQETLLSLQTQGITHSAFGDIFLENLKNYRESQLAQIGMEGLFPIWQEKPEKILEEFWQAGYKAIVVCVNEKYLDASFVGRPLDESFIGDLPPEVDICGENGEFHSFVYEGPIFSRPIPFTKGEIVFRTYGTQQNTPSQWDSGFWYCDLLP